MEDIFERAQTDVERFLSNRRIATSDTDARDLLQQLAQCREAFEDQRRELVDSRRSMGELAQSLEQRYQSQLAASRVKERQLRAVLGELQVAEQRERRRIAGDLHDYLAQLLVAARLRTANIRATLGDDEAVSSLRSVEDMLRQSLIYTRTLMAEISPAVLFESGLAPAIRQLATQMNKQNLEVDISNVREVNASEATRVLLYQCIRELLHNCLKHSATDKAYVSLRALDGHIQTVVRDDGRGMRLNTLEAGEPLREKFGLFSIRERVEVVDGSFFIESSPGNGMTCVIEVPSDGEQTSEEQEGSEQSREVNKDANAIRVLVVDDHTALRQGLVRYFADLHDVTVAGEAGSGEEAVDKAAALTPDAVLMDINLPDMNGVEATRRIKAHRPETAVVGLSMRFDDAIVSEMRNAGAAIHLGKDAPIEQIVRHLRKACGREPSGV